MKRKIGYLEFELIFKERKNIQAEQWTPTEAQLQNAISLIEDFFGKEWLKQQGQLNQKPKQFANKFTHHLKPEPHPIVPLYLKSIETLNLIKSGKQDYFDISSLRLISYFENFNKLKRIGIVSIDGKKISSSSENKFKDRLKLVDEFFQTTYEIQIAVALARQGFSTWFIEETNVKTPDILVVFRANRFYVECKYQGLTSREELYENVFREFYWRSMRSMFRLGDLCSICVEWLRAPTTKDVMPTITLLEERMKNK